MPFFINKTESGETISCNYSRMESIGNLIRIEMQKQERSISWMARKLGCDRAKVYRLLEKNSIDTYLLMQISQLLSHNFFKDLSENLDKEEEEM